MNFSEAGRAYSPSGVASGRRVYMTPAARFEGVQIGAALVLAITSDQIQPGWIPSVADLFAEDWSVWNDS